MGYLAVLLGIGVLCRIGIIDCVYVLGKQYYVYTRYAAVTPVACVANCPVCDLPYHYTERPDLPRTLYSAFGDSDSETLGDAMKKASPYHLALKREMPKMIVAERASMGRYRMKK